MKIRIRRRMPAAALSGLAVLMIGAARSARTAGEPARTAPQIERLDPGSVLAGAPAFVLTVRGNFMAADSVVRWNDEDRPTTIGGTAFAYAAIPATDVAAPGFARVTVLTPSLSGGRPSVSSPQIFRIRAPNSFENP